MSLRKAINDMCRQCIYDPHAVGTWRQQVTICTSFDCPLYPVRPKWRRPVPESMLAHYGLKMTDFPPNCGFTVQSHGRDGDSVYSVPETGRSAPEMEGK